MCFEKNVVGWHRVSSHLYWLSLSPTGGDGSPASGHDYHLPAEPSLGGAYTEDMKGPQGQEVRVWAGACSLRCALACLSVRMHQRGRHV